MEGIRTAAEPRGDRRIQWVFLDRDGTLNAKAPDGEYVERPQALELLPGVAEAIKKLNQAGIWTGVVTNQRGVALGRMSIEDLDAIHVWLRHLLSLDGAYLDAIYACTHQIGTCDCRKPDPGLLLRAQREHPGLDFARAAIVGDSASDVQTGKRLGLMTVLLSAEDEPRAACEADYVVADLAGAVYRLLGEPIVPLARQ